MDPSKKRVARHRRHLRIRKQVRGTVQRPRLSVYRSNKHIYAQLVDDVAGTTLVAASSMDAPVNTDGAKSATAAGVGTLLGERASAAGITTCVFDRGGNRYSGRVAALADAAREAGLEF
ncbi:MAG: 50S ribosomal protein L18 [Nitriliruptoraceae bacterium]